METFELNWKTELMFNTTRLLKEKICLKTTYNIPCEIRTESVKTFSRIMDVFYYRNVTLDTTCRPVS